MDNHLEILEETLRLQHVAPTAPDTLGKSKSVSGTFCLLDRSHGPNVSKQGHQTPHCCCSLWGLSAVLWLKPPLPYVWLESHRLF